MAPKSLQNQGAEKIDVAFNNEPAIEVFVQVSHIALTCALTAQGLAAANAVTTEAAALMAARTNQDRTYHEVVEGDRCQLVVVGLGDWARVES